MIYFTLFFVMLSILAFNNKIWFLKIFDFFRLQYAVIFFLISIYAAFTLQIVVLSLSILFLILNMHRIWLYHPKLSFSYLKPIKDKKDIMSINAYINNKSLDELNQVILKADPTIILLMEITDRHKNHMSKVFEKYPYKLETPVRDGFNICLLSKNKMEHSDITYHSKVNSPFLQADIKLNNKIYSFYSSHPKPAFNKKWDNERHEYFKAIEPIIRKSKYAPIIMGDFNSVPWESDFVKFLNNTNTRSTLTNNGYKVTWPKYFLPMGIPMDHIVIGQDVNFTDLKCGPSCGSDHYPIAMDIVE